MHHESVLFYNEVLEASRCAAAASPAERRPVVAEATPAQTKAFSSATHGADMAPPGRAGGLGRKMHEDRVTRAFGIAQPVATRSQSARLATA